MSDWILYHIYGIRGFKIVGQEKVQNDAAVMTIVPVRSQVCCPVCRSQDVIRKGVKHRFLLGTPIGRRRMYFDVAVPRVNCKDCGITRQISLPFAEQKLRHTRQFERYALELARLTTTRNAANHLGVSWDTVRDIEVRYLSRKYKKPKLKTLRQIAIDEIYLGKGMKYLTIVLNLETGAIVFVGQGKGAAALDPFWPRLRGSRAKIEAVAADMSPAYALAVRQHLPHAALVNDRFHVIKLYNEMLTELRRQLHREATDKLHRQVLKGIRWLLLRRTDNLDKDEPERLLRALQLNESLAIAYYLKDDLNQFWEQPDQAAASRYLDAWLEDAWNSGIKLLMKFANTLAGHRTGLLAWYDYPISTGPLEGVNNKIGLCNRQAYGYRDQEFFILKLFALHETKVALVS